MSVCSFQEPVIDGMLRPGWGSGADWGAPTSATSQNKALGTQAKVQESWGQVPWDLGALDPAGGLGHLPGKWASSQSSGDPI